MDLSDMQNKNNHELLEKYYKEEMLILLDNIQLLFDVIKEEIEDFQSTLLESSINIGKYNLSVNKVNKAIEDYSEDFESYRQLGNDILKYSEYKKMAKDLLQKLHEFYMLIFSMKSNNPAMLTTLIQDNYTGSMMIFKQILSSMCDINDAVEMYKYDEEILNEPGFMETYDRPYFIDIEDFVNVKNSEDHDKELASEYPYLKSFVSYNIIKNGNNILLANFLRSLIEEEIQEDNAELVDSFTQGLTKEKKQQLKTEIDKNAFLIETFFDKFEAKVSAYTEGISHTLFEQMNSKQFETYQNIKRRIDENLKKAHEQTFNLTLNYYNSATREIEEDFNELLDMIDDESIKSIYHTNFPRSTFTLLQRFTYDTFYKFAYMNIAELTNERDLLIEAFKNNDGLLTEFYNDYRNDESSIMQKYGTYYNGNITDETFLIQFIRQREKELRGPSLFMERYNHGKVAKILEDHGEKWQQNYEQYLHEQVTNNSEEQQRETAGRELEIE